jgi:hypothetical protein
LTRLFAKSSCRTAIWWARLRMTRLLSWRRLSVTLKKWAASTNVFEKVLNKLFGS